MRRVIYIALLATMAATTADSMSAVISVYGDGKASLDEMTFAYPDLTEAFGIGFEIIPVGCLGSNNTALAIKADMIEDWAGDV